MKKKFNVGMTTGAYDMFHVGHLNLLRNAKRYCDFLVVGLYTDECIKEYKNKDTIIKLEDRKAVVEAIKYVDKVIVLSKLDKVKAWEEVGYNALLIGDDWRNHPRWKRTEKEMKKLGVEVIYLPYTKGVSTTKIKDRLYKQLLRMKEVDNDQ